MKAASRTKGAPKCLDPRLLELEELGLDLSTFDFVIGLDEVGVACLAGPVVAGCYAYALKADWVHNWEARTERTALIRDSKQLNEKQREVSESWMREHAQRESTVFAIAEATVAEIDEINIFWASKLAMQRAFAKVLTQLETHSSGLWQPAQSRALVLVDGNHVPKTFQVLSENFTARCLVKGDTRVFSIAAASIFAKNYRDTLMKELAQKFPFYAWDTNVGYPTPVHQRALGEHGPTEWHRRSFRLDYT